MKIRETLISNIVIDIKKNELPFCLCGCGRRVTNKKNKYINGHNGSGKIRSLETRLKMAKNHSKPWLGQHHSKKTIEKLKKYQPWNKGKTNCYSQETKLKQSKIKIGKKLSEETKQKISKIHKGSHRSLDTRKKQSKAGTGRKHSIESKLKMSISAIKYISKTEFNGGPTYPRIGKNEKYIIDQIQTETNLELLRNNYNLALQIGKFPDAYNIKYNVVIEILEPWHFKENNELIDYDLNRQQIISYHLGCMIYYIPEQEFLKNSEKEIQRFKDFLLLLEQERN